MVKGKTYDMGVPCHQEDRSSQMKRVLFDFDLKGVLPGGERTKRSGQGGIKIRCYSTTRLQRWMRSPTLQVDN